MKKSLPVIFLSAFIISFQCIKAQQLHNTPGYDSTLAQKLGADEYGMKQYFLKKVQTGHRIPFIGQKFKMHT
jgi:hypothetical protein